LSKLGRAVDQARRWQAGQLPGLPPLRYED